MVHCSWHSSFCCSSSGLLDSQVDFFSRVAVSEHEWSLSLRYLSPAFSKFDHPEIDLLATANNTKCARYYSRFSQELGTSGDTFLHHWDRALHHMFPPFPLILCTIQMIMMDGTSCILVTPWWPQLVWFAHLLHLSWGVYHQFPPVQVLLSLRYEAVLHHDPAFFKLTGWRVGPWIFLWLYRMLCSMLISLQWGRVTIQNGQGFQFLHILGPWIQSLFPSQWFFHTCWHWWTAWVYLSHLLRSTWLPFPHFML